MRLESSVSFSYDKQLSSFRLFDVVRQLLPKHVSVRKVHGGGPAEVIGPGSEGYLRNRHQHCRKLGKQPRHALAESMRRLSQMCA